MNNIKRFIALAFLFVFAVLIVLSQDYINGTRTIEGGINFCLDTSVTLNVYTCNLSPPIVAYRSGTHYSFKSTHTVNAGPSTLNLNGLGAIAIRKTGGSLALTGGEIPNGAVVDVVYDGTFMQAQSFGGGGSGGAGTSPTSTSFTAQTSVPISNVFASPAVLTACYANSGVQLQSESITVTTSTVTVTFASPQTGYCILNGGIGPAGPTGPVGPSGSGGSVFTGSTAVSSAFSATPTFSGADLSVKSPTRFEVGVLTGNVTAVTFTNMTAGDKFSILWTQDSTGGRTVTYGGSTNNTCPIVSFANFATLQQFEVGSDGSTVNGAGCVSNGGPDIYGSETAGVLTPGANLYACNGDSTDHSGLVCGANNSVDRFKTVKAGVDINTATGVVTGANGALIPTSKPLVGTNSLGQIIAGAGSVISMQYSTGATDTTNRLSANAADANTTVAVGTTAFGLVDSLPANMCAGCWVEESACFAITTPATADALTIQLFVGGLNTYTNNVTTVQNSQGGVGTCFTWTMVATAAPGAAVPIYVQATTGSFPGTSAFQLMNNRVPQSPATNGILAVSVHAAWAGAHNTGNLVWLQMLKSTRFGW